MSFRKFGQSDQANYHKMMQHAFGDIDTTGLQVLHSLAKAYHMLSGLAERQVGTHNLSIAKIRLLFWLKSRYDDGTDGGGLLPSELSKFQGVMPNTVSSLLNSLRTTGLVEQATHPKDRRKHIIKITQEGRDLLQEIAPIYPQYLDEVLHDLSQDERQTLLALLNKVIDAIVPLICDPNTGKPPTSDET